MISSMAIIAEEYGLIGASLILILYTPDSCSGGVVLC